MLVILCFNTFYFIVIVILIIVIIAGIFIFKKKVKGKFDASLHMDSLSAENPVYSESSMMNESSNYVIEGSSETNTN